ncbi:hydrolase [Photobacterium lutimaris]|uniref:Hydrolase n=2 Tax=Photobacterium lutimaris TaxID=388278 RepID=A0A2T3J294_9GAMM|nr:hydrolase [Photobacterium lutimaris]TDR77196.1 imidazolonepropionase-like amidohydrolase [Photobacterium lutimaris]
MKNSREKSRLTLPISALALVMSSSALAQDINQTLISDVNIFNGIENKLYENLDVLIENNKVVEIASGIKPSEGATVIDGQGKTLMPGLTDAHVHLTLNDVPNVSIYEDTIFYSAALSVVGAKDMLLRGFTTVRDVGGPVGGIKRAIDSGKIPGPRVYPSNAFISQTSGHGDLATSKQYISPYFTGIPDKAALFGWSYIADGVPEVQKAAREVLRSGATQLKVMAGGGVSSYYDPLDTLQYTYEEMKAITTEAEHWGTYVAVHAYTDGAVKQAVEAGVKSIEHGPFLKEDTLKLMGEKGVWLSPQAFLFGMTPEQLNIVGTPSEPKMRMVNEKSEKMLTLAKKYNVKIAWGTDLFGPPEKQALQNMEFAARKKYFSDYEILKQATSDNAELFRLSGLRDPYQQEAKLGVVEVGAYADLLIIDGNPLKDVSLLGDPSKNIQMIMKDGVVYKNTLK